jgi:hypothetical protein
MTELTMSEEQGHQEDKKGTSKQKEQATTDQQAQPATMSAEELRAKLRSEREDAVQRLRDLWRNDDALNRANQKLLSDEYERGYLAGFERCDEIFALAWYGLDHTKWSEIASELSRVTPLLSEEETDFVRNLSSLRAKPSHEERKRLLRIASRVLPDKWACEGW